MNTLKRMLSTAYWKVCCFIAETLEEEPKGTKTPEEYTNLRTAAIVWRKKADAVKARVFR